MVCQPFVHYIVVPGVVKPVLYGEGVAVDKLKYHGHYKSYTALLGSALIPLV